ncbi:MAG: tetratricopeptide repeat protein [Aureispira sp.]
MTDPITFSSFLMKGAVSLPVSLVNKGIISGWDKLTAKTLDDVLYKEFVTALKTLLQENNPTLDPRQKQYLAKVLTAFQKTTGSIISKKKKRLPFLEALHQGNDLNALQLVNALKEESYRTAVAQSILEQYDLIRDIQNPDLDEATKIQVTKDILSKGLIVYSANFLAQLNAPLQQEEVFKQVLGIANTVNTNNAISAAIQAELMQLNDKINAININFENQFVAVLSESFWEEQKNRPFKKERALINYYLHAKSTTAFLFNIVVHQLQEDNIVMRQAFGQCLQKAIASEKQFSLIKILAAGGTGKSTFLLNLAHYYQKLYFILFLDGAKVKDFVAIIAAINKMKSNISPHNPILIMVDNAAAFDNLYQLPEQLENNFNAFNFVMVIAEREFRYNEVSTKEAFENHFLSPPLLIQYVSDEVIPQIFNRFAQILLQSQQIDNQPTISNIRKEASAIFFRDQTFSVVDRIYQTLIELKANDRIQYTFDWEDWDAFIDQQHKTNPSRWKELYTLIALFYQFGLPLELELCSKHANIDLDLLLNTIRADEVNFPIYRYTQTRHSDGIEYLALRHEKVAEWYFRQGNSKQKQERAIYFLKVFLEGIEGQLEEYLLLKLLKQPELAANFIYKNFWEATAKKKTNQTKKQTVNQLRIQYLPVFTTTKYQLLTEIGHTFVRTNQPKQALEYLEKAIELNPNNIHSYTELGKVYQKLSKFDKAEEVLLKAIQIDSQNVHTRTELGKVYQQQQEWNKAEEVLLMAIQIDSQNVHSRTELGKVYQQQQEWNKAEEVLLKAIELNPHDDHPRITLAKIYKELLLWNKMELILRSLLTIQPQNNYAFDLLVKGYKAQGLEQQKRVCLLKWHQLVPYHNLCIPSLVDEFKAVKRYSIAIHLLEKTLTSPFKNLFILNKLLHTQLHIYHIKEVAPLIQEGFKLSKTSTSANAKNFFERKYQEITHWKNPLQLIKFQQVGHYQTDKIISNNKHYPLVKKTTKSKKVRRGNQVFYNLYQHQETGSLYANFIEPYYEVDRLDDPDYLRDLLE